MLLVVGKVVMCGLVMVVNSVDNDTMLVGGEVVNVWIGNAIEWC